MKKLISTGEGSIVQNALLVTCMVVLLTAGCATLREDAGSNPPPAPSRPEAPKNPPANKPPAPADVPASTQNQPAATQASQPEGPREKLEIGGETFELEIAATDAQRERGLMERDHIDEHGGMLFIYAFPQPLSYWMKNCPIEMDILFVDDHGRIVTTHRMKAAPPRRPRESEAEYDARLPLYPAARDCQFAIELKAGTVQRLKIKPGQKIEMDVKRLGAMAGDDDNR